MSNNRRIDILLVEDNPGDITLVTQALEETDLSPGVECVRDGIQAMRFLKQEGPFENAPRPAIVLLDLNLPCKDGREVLGEIKSDPALASTPVVILSGSDAPQDIAACYALHANCYIVKPRDLFSLTETMNCLVDFWFREVKLPQAPSLDSRR